MNIAELMGLGNDDSDDEGKPEFKMLVLPSDGVALVDEFTQSLKEANRLLRELQEKAMAVHAVVEKDRQRLWVKLGAVLGVDLTPDAAEAGYDLSYRELGYVFLRYRPVAKTKPKGRRIRGRLNTLPKLN